MATDTDRDEIVTIVRLVDQSPCREFQLEIGALRLMLRKDGASPTPPAGNAPPSPAPGADPAPSSAPSAPAPSPARIDWAPVEGFPVKAPMLGIFYRAPGPGAPPFVEVGSKVEAGTTLCIVEVMKVMNTIKADRPGTIAAIYPANAAMIEFGEIIMVIREEAAA